MMGDTVKLAVLGCGNVGKSALTLQFCYDEFLEEYEPTKGDNYNKVVSFGGKDIALHIFDTAGQEEYQSVRDHFLRNCDGFLVVYDVTERETFEQVDSHLESIKRIRESKEDAYGHVSSHEKLPVVLVGNKVDCDGREVSASDGATFASRNGIGFIETSAKTTQNVQAAFFEVVKILHDNRHTPNAPSGNKNNASIASHKHDSAGGPKRKGLFRHKIFRRCCFIS